MRDMATGQGTTFISAFTMLPTDKQWHALGVASLPVTRKGTTKHRIICCGVYGWVEDGRVVTRIVRRCQIVTLRMAVMLLEIWPIAVAI